MKKVIVTVALCIIGMVTIRAAEGNNLLLDADFPNNSKVWGQNNPESFVITEDAQLGKRIMAVKGIADASKNAWIRNIQTIKGLSQEKIANNKFRFGANVKVVKISGKFQIAIREVDEAGKSITYKTISLGKFDSFDWKTLESTFTASAQTASLHFFIIANYMGVADELYLCSPFLYQVTE